MGKVLEGLGWLLLGIGILVMAFVAFAILGAYFGSDSSAMPDARGMIQGISSVALFFVGIPCTAIGALLVSRAKPGRKR